MSHKPLKIRHDEKRKLQYMLLFIIFVITIQLSIISNKNLSTVLSYHFTNKAPSVDDGTFLGSIPVGEVTVPTHDNDGDDDDDLDRMPTKSSSSSSTATIGATENLIVIVTGYSNNHYSVLMRDLLPTVVHRVMKPATAWNNRNSTLPSPPIPLLEGPIQIKVLCYDLNPLHIRKTNESSSMVKRLKSEFPFVEMRNFKYDSYPSHFNIETGRGQYAWKPAIVSEVVSQYQNVKSNSAFVYWLDAGLVITRDLFGDDLRVAQRQGIYTPSSPGTLKKWTHEATAQYLGMDMTLFHQTQQPICSAGILLIHVKNKTIVDRVIQPWMNCALVKECIGPTGSNRTNHRQDQSALSVLLNMLKIDIWIEGHERSIVRGHG